MNIGYKNTPHIRIGVEIDFPFVLRLSAYLQRIKTISIIVCGHCMWALYVGISTLVYWLHVCERFELNNFLCYYIKGALPYIKISFHYCWSLLQYSGVRLIFVISNKYYIAVSWLVLRKEISLQLRKSYKFYRLF